LDTNFFFHFLFFFVSFRFFIKLPIYGVHLWLPKAHVEAPVAGSIILAAILLKLSRYGFYRVLFLFSFILKKTFLLVSLFLIFGALISGGIAITQRDIKSLIAYSSISHIGIIIGGGILITNISLKGIFLILLGHGFCSSALFFFG